MNYAEWLAQIDVLAPNSTIVEENGEIVIKTALSVRAVFDGRSSIPADELEIVPMEMVL